MPSRSKQGTKIEEMGFWGKEIQNTPNLIRIGTSCPETSTPMELIDFTQIDLMEIIRLKEK
jgi:hypothetical protein